MADHSCWHRTAAPSRACRSDKSMDNLMYILFAAALTDNMVATSMHGVTLVHSTRQTWPMSALLAAATAILLLLAVTIGYVLELMRFAGEDGLVVPLLLPLLALLILAADSKIKQVTQRWKAVLALVMANTAILAIPLANAAADLSLTTRITHAIGSAAGFGLLLLTICELRQRIWLTDIPKALRGLPIMLLMLASMAMALHGLRT